VSSVGNNNHGVSPTEALARRLEQLAEAGGLRATLRATGIAKAELSVLAAEAAEQWTGTFNPRPFDQKGALEVYEWAY
jgi:alcohol dehydrogenase